MKRVGGRVLTTKTRRARREREVSPLLRCQNHDSPAGGRETAPRLSQAHFNARELTRPGLAAQLKDDLRKAIEAARFKGMAHSQHSSGNIDRRFASCCCFPALKSCGCRP